MGRDCGEKDEGMGLGKRIGGWDWAKGCKEGDDGTGL